MPKRRRSTSESSRSRVPDKPPQSSNVPQQINGTTFESSLPRVPDTPPQSSNVPQQIVVSEQEERETTNGEYEVVLTPHPQKGIGLNLGGQDNGLPPFVVQFMRSPSTSSDQGILPAEQCGLVQPGDEILGINDIDLRKFSFLEVCERIRSVCLSGKHIKLKFRPGAAMKEYSYNMKINYANNLELCFKTAHSQFAYVDSFTRNRDGTKHLFERVGSIRRGDRLLSVNGKSLENMTLERIRRTMFEEHLVNNDSNLKLRFRTYPFYRNSHKLSMIRNVGPRELRNGAEIFEDALKLLNAPHMNQERRVSDFDWLLPSDQRQLLINRCDTLRKVRTQLADQLSERHSVENYSIERKERESLYHSTFRELFEQFRTLLIVPSNRGSSSQPIFTKEAVTISTVREVLQKLREFDRSQND